MDYSTIAGVGGSAATGVFAVLGWVLKRSVSQLDKKIEAHDEAIQKRADELAAFKLHAAESYVTNSALEKAIDRFSAAIDAVYKKLERIDYRLAEKQDKQ